MLLYKAMRVFKSFKIALKLDALVLPPFSFRSSIARFSTSLGAPKFPRTTRHPLILSTKSMASSISSPKPVVQVKDKIELTEIEEKIFNRLLGTLRHFNLETQLRVAGGWVRDKVVLYHYLSLILWDFVSFFAVDEPEFHELFLGFGGFFLYF